MRLLFLEGQKKGVGGRSDMCGIPTGTSEHLNENGHSVFLLSALSFFFFQSIIKSCIASVEVVLYEAAFEYCKMLCYVWHFVGKKSK